MTHTKETQEQVQTSVEEQHQIRVEKVKQLREQGIDPWLQAQIVAATAAQVLREYQEDEEVNYTVAGRVVALRWHGKTGFAHLQDSTGKLQIYLRKDILGDESFDWVQHYIDLGDIVWVAGSSFKTKTGEVTLKATELKLLSKCLHPLPEKFHGLTDVEVRYRQRYLDLISNPQSKARFLQRSKIISEIRHYLERQNYIEVETPMLHPIPGGATARPFVTHHNALDTNLYLRVAPELYLKRLVVGGLDRVFEINRNFRNEGISTRHNPEFTMLEYYTAHQDYHAAMSFLERMLLSLVATCTATGTTLPFGEHEIDYATPFQRMSIREAILKYTDCDETALTEAAIDATLKKYHVTVQDKAAGYHKKLYALFEEQVEQLLIQPTFIIDFPIVVSPLAKRDAEDPLIAARFELFIGGMEIGNAFNELNDPFDQAARFKEQASARDAGDEEAHYFDADYIKALEYGLPPTVGVGLGIDRLVMLLTNTTSIRDVILFPTLRSK